MSRHVYTEEIESTLIQGDATRHLYREKVDGPRIQERPSRHLRKETTRPLSMTEEFQVYPYTGGSDPTLIQGDI